MRPPTTAEIQATLAFPLGDFNCQRCVDWATDRLVSGDDSKALRILAGLSTPFNLFEVAARRDQVLAERNLLLQKEQAILPYVHELVARLTDTESDIADVLQHLFQLCVDREYDADLFDFYLLECARADLEQETYSYHWMEARRENFSDICRQVAAKWLEEHPNS